VRSITGVEDDFREEFIVYPNPSLGKFTISGLQKNTKPIQMTIFSTQGKIVYSSSILQNSTTKTIDLSFLKSGMYLINITADDIEYAQRTIIIF